MDNFKSILLENKKFLEFPGVYRFVGINPQTNEPNTYLYVGIAGENAYNYLISIIKKQIKNKEKPQLLFGRLKRHLENDAGVLGDIIQDIKYIQKIEYWILDPNNQNHTKVISDQSKFKEKEQKNLLKYMEFSLRKKEKTFYDELGITDYTNLKKPTIDRELENFAEQILNDEKKTIDFESFDLPQIEKEFLDQYRYITSCNFKKYLYFRQYKKIVKVLDNFYKSWLALKSAKIAERNLHWHYFEDFDNVIKYSPNEISQDESEEDLIEEQQFDWETWLSRKIKKEILLFSVENELKVKIHKERDKQYLMRNPEVDRILLNLIQRINNNTNMKGILSIIYWKIKDEIIPLYISISENGANFDSRNLARWGYTDARIFSDLSKAYFENTSKYKNWIHLLFTNRFERILKNQVYFYAIEWPSDEDPDIKISLSDLKEELIINLTPYLNKKSEKFKKKVLANGKTIKNDQNEISDND